jgi:RHH-type proline utilization regulon transcriptional repressor/proline dehydrogenase/delta 1-pyrroline-5-carboxylate dehydrogenase
VARGDAARSASARGAEHHRRRHRSFGGGREPGHGAEAISLAAASIDWDSLDKAKHRDEVEAIRDLIAATPSSPADRVAVVEEAQTLVRAARGIRRHGVVESFLKEFSLSTPEGLALMCLAEALLRTPDQANRDRLIAETIGKADWAGHLGKSDDLFVNASTWGLMLAGELVEPETEARRDFPTFLKRLAGRVGEPVVRRAVAAAVAIISEQFVLGRTIEEALGRAEADGLTCSFDMLGEGARTADDAARYEKAYAEAIAAVGARAGGEGPEAGHGVSVKLSALSPRYEAVQEARVWDELYPRLVRLAVLAARNDINLTIDAEEADRLVTSLKLLDRLTREPELGGWRGLGVAVQAYQKRAPQVIAALARLAEDSGRRLMARLVKGAYWDAEIKRAQVAGRPDYPVYTTKAATDVSYLVSARALIAAFPRLYGQFATHNAHTLAAVRRMADQAGAPIEFQRLHGMGEALYAAAREGRAAFPLRTYAPVGGHADLLPYLVRRLLENGANTAFVHALTDERIPVAEVAADPIAALEVQPGPHPRIARPPDLFRPERKNSLGLDLSIRSERRRLADAVVGLDHEPLVAGPLIGGALRSAGAAQARTSPADKARIVGQAFDSASTDIDEAFRLARAAQPQWDQAGGAARAALLRATGDAIEADLDRLVAILAREGGKTLADGVAEVREAADFCRYYASLAEAQFAAPIVLPGPAGETNTLGLRGRGVFACISPWNFPLSIFTGQVAAALAAGDAVVAKPAEQTPLIAAEAVSLFHRAGLDPRLLALMPGPGETVGAALVSHPRLDGVAFTGGTETAWTINRALAARGGPIVPFIAETGGLNGLFVDTTALREQVIDDVIASAFGSAGQRCSALRVLFLPRETADELIAGVIGAMDALVIGDPADPAVDIGPLIDGEAKTALERHLERLRADARVWRAPSAPDPGLFFSPVLAEIASPAFLQREVFGPILHVVRYDSEDLEAVARTFAERRYGLTLGVHSRLQNFVDTVARLVPAGNLYVNRSIIGAVVGVQPFGGEGLSGTGPKAGGPNSLLRYAVERSLSVNIAARGGDPALLNL